MAGNHARYDRVGPLPENWAAQLMVSARRHGLSDRLGELHDTLKPEQKAGPNGADWRDALDARVLAFTAPRDATATAHPVAAEVVASAAPVSSDMCWPVAAGPEGPVITSPFGPRRAPEAGASTFHPGVDFQAHAGTPIQTPQAGVVIEAGPRAKGGGTIMVQYDDGSLGGFAHTGAMPGLKVGDRVGACTVIGVSDGSGTNNPHLHYTFRPGAADHPASVKTAPVDSMQTQFAGRPFQRKKKP